jgi:hypothetical protein
VPHRGRAFSRRCSFGERFLTRVDLGRVRRLGPVGARAVPLPPVGSRRRRQGDRDLPQRAATRSSSRRSG